MVTLARGRIVRQAASFGETDIIMGGTTRFLLADSDPRHDGVTVQGDSDGTVAGRIPARRLQGSVRRIRRHHHR